MQGLFFVLNLNCKINSRMKNRIMNQGKIIFIICIFISISGCKKKEDAQLPKIQFKSGGIYTSEGGTVTKVEAKTVGIIADKNVADLRTFRVLHSMGSNPTDVEKNYTMASNEKSHFETDFKFNIRSTQGIEKWFFDVEDLNGNKAELELDFTAN